MQNAVCEKMSATIEILLFVMLIIYSVILLGVQYIGGIRKMSRGHKEQLQHTVIISGLWASLRL